MMLKSLSRLARRLVYGGSTSFTALEQFVIDNVAKALPVSERSVLMEQLQHVEVIQRNPSRRITAIFFSKDVVLPLLPNIEPEHCLAHLRIKPSGNSRILRIAVMSHRGRLSSIEFRGSPDVADDGPLKVETLELHAQDKGIASVIDRAEHGS